MTARRHCPAFIRAAEHALIAALVRAAKAAKEEREGAARLQAPRCSDQPQWAALARSTEGLHQ